MSALELFRGRTIDIATTAGVVSVDGLAYGAFHIRPQVDDGTLIYTVSHLPTGMKIPATIAGLSIAADMVVELLALDIDWAEATIDSIRLHGKVVVPIVKKYGQLYSSTSHLRAESIKVAGQRLNAGGA